MFYNIYIFLWRTRIAIDIANIIDVAIEKINGANEEIITASVIKIDGVSIKIFTMKNSSVFPKKYI